MSRDGREHAYVCLGRHVKGRACWFSSLSSRGWCWGPRKYHSSPSQTHLDSVIPFAQRLEEGDRLKPRYLGTCKEKRERDVSECQKLAARRDYETIESAQSKRHTFAGSQKPVCFDDDQQTKGGDATNAMAKQGLVLDLFRHVMAE